MSKSKMILERKKHPYFAKKKNSENFNNKRLKFKQHFFLSKFLKSKGNVGKGQPSGVTNFADGTCAQERPLEPKVLELLLLSNVSQHTTHQVTDDVSKFYPNCQSFNKFARSVQIAQFRIFPHFSHYWFI